MFFAQDLKSMWLDKSIMWGLFFLCWSFLAGPITSLIILIYFDAEFQGYFYTIVQLALLVQLGDMGLNTILLFLISRAYSKINKNKDVYKNLQKNNSSKTLALVKLLYVYSLKIPFIIFPIIFLIGLLYFDNSNKDLNYLLYTWLFLCIAVSIDLVTVFLIAKMEALDNVALSNKLKFIKVFVRSISLWFFLALGFKLDSIAFSTLISVLIFLFLYLKYYKNFFLETWNRKKLDKIKWRKEIWPLQWRMAITWIFGAYILYNSNLIAVFYFLGPVDAGKFGIIFTICEAIFAVSYLWVQTSTPKITYLIAVKKFIEAKNMLVKKAIFAIAMTMFLGILLFIFLCFIKFYFPIYYERLLPVEFLPFLIFAGVFRHLIQSLTVFVRANKKEDLMLSYLMAGVLTIVLNWILIPTHGLFGVCISIFIVTMFIHLPTTVILFNLFIKKNKIKLV